MPTAAPTQPAAGSFPYIHYGSTNKDAYASAGVTAASADGRCSVSLDQAANGVILVRMDNGVAGNKALVTTPTGSQFQYNIQPGIWLGLPCNGGSGSYTVMLLENVGGSTFLPLLNESFNVSLSSWLRPYTAASVMMNFGSGSSAVQVSNSICAGLTTADAKVSAVYQWVTSNISYDSALAARIGTGAVTTYTPDIEAIMSSRTGICFDYAAIMASMLRSQGIPTKLVMGYVPQGYHAWNEVFFEGVGWVIVASFRVAEVNGSAFVMFDTTFGAGGMSIDSINAVSRQIQRVY